ncbi:hypothetical protein WDW37_13490 [Bdellovibrionota bacterium FG-1]
MAPLVASDSEKAPWVLGQGEQRILRLAHLLKYTLGGPCIHGKTLSSHPEGPERDGIRLLLKATCPGRADLWISYKNGTAEHRSIRIEKVTPTELPPLLERALGHLEETEVILSGEGVVLRGEVRNSRESARIRSLIEQFAKNVRDQTEPSPEFLTSTQKQLDSYIQNTPGAAALQIEKQGRSLFVRGSLERPAFIPEFERHIRQIYPQAILELDALPDAAPTVYFRVFLLELKKSRFRNLGLSWSGRQEGAFRITSGGLTDALSLDIALEALEGDGSVKILSNPELVVRAPGEAELFAGGELPIKVKTRVSHSVVWKNYGLTLRLKVTHSSGDRVRLDIFTEVSHLDSSIALEDIPGIQVNRMNTQVDARYGVPLLLSGLLQQGMREQAKGLPFLRNIPILGRLFSSEDYLTEKSELVAILLPASSPPSASMSPFTGLTPESPRNALNAAH